MSIPVNNINDLRAEIARLRIVKVQQELAIKQRFNSPSAIFNTVLSGFSGTGGADKTSGTSTTDELIGLVSRFVLPMVLNKTLFRNSNFIVKTLVGILSQAASGYINEKSLFALWDTIQPVLAMVAKPMRKTKKPVDYGIPPLSETS